MIDAAQQADEHAEPVWFLPYLSGERTPHNNPQAKGVFFGLTHQHGPAELAQAVLEGVGFALADGMDVVHACGVQPASITLIGGGHAVNTGVRCYLTSADCSWITVPAVTLALHSARRAWRKLP